ncbi:MAG: SDR family oxidoreductase [Leptospiraceae bacterium]|nr:SDR family oxidoreductase [Leptospiraceae bacterium]MCP5513129.1 SDR family oxidoreductase [Leptospiraceae bacterium]
MNNSLKGLTFLVTGIIDSGSLALSIAKQIRSEGGDVICTGLGKTKYHENLSEKAISYLEKSYESFSKTIEEELGKETMTLPLDVTLDKSIEEVADTLEAKSIQLNGFIHSIAMDKSIKSGMVVKPLLQITKEEFFQAMEVSAFSIIPLTKALLDKKVLQNNSSILALSYIGAEKIVQHPYKNIGIAKAALERIVKELAFELGKSHSMRVNAIRFSPYTGSKAGSAIQGLQEAVDFCDSHSPLGNARPEDIALESTYLLQPNLRVTGEIRNVDGGYHIRG